MFKSAPTPAVAPPRALLPGAVPSGTPISTHDDTDSELEATVATWCPPVEWRDLEGESVPAPAARDLAPEKSAPARIAVPWADRRMSDRLPVRPGCRAEVRRWGGAGNPDLAEELLNVSEVGVGVRLSAPVRRGERFDVTLWGPGAEWCGRGIGVVRWSVVFGGGTILAGLQLGRPLTVQALAELTAASVLAKSTCPPPAASR